MVEVHPAPDDALSDAAQQLTLEQFEELMKQLVPVHEHVRGLHDEVGPGMPVMAGTGDALARH
jgi:3-deoxy-D-manno-octulosonic acid (KDO) 8-phosphate synthase